jgi:hypothetical protein
MSLILAGSISLDSTFKDDIPVYLAVIILMVYYHPLKMGTNFTNNQLLLFAKRIEEGNREGRLCTSYFTVRGGWFMCKSVPLPPEPKAGGGGHTHLRGVGQSQFRRLEKKLRTLSTLWIKPS